MKRIALAILALLASSVSGADFNFAALRFGMSPGDVERVLGAGGIAQRFSNPEVEHVSWYRSARTRDMLPQAYFDRSYDAVAFGFSYVNQENNGNNPRTGKPWEIPPDVGRWVLALFAPGGQWTRLKDEGSARIWRSSNGKFFARITSDEIRVSDREAIVRLQLQYQ